MQLYEAGAAHDAWRKAEMKRQQQLIPEAQAERDLVTNLFEVGTEAKLKGA